MIFEVSFALIGGVNFGLEKSWKLVESLIRRYPGAIWKRKIYKKKGEGKYIVEIN